MLTPFLGDRIVNFGISQLIDINYMLSNRVFFESGKGGSYRGDPAGMLLRGDYR